MNGRKKNQKNQFIILAILTIGIVLLTGILDYLNSTIYRRFIGDLNPFLTMLFLALSGFLLLRFSVSKGWFAILGELKLHSLSCYFGLTLMSALTAILVDLKIVFPADMNILFPESLLFYPTIGFGVEILFHLLPLSVLLFFLTLILKDQDHNKAFWVCILIIATLEPTYQTIFMDSFPTIATVVVWTNLFLFNLLQLIVFKKYGFISMYSLRLLYYSIWHISWGYFRLQLLF